jgi:hypothetical protein
VAGDGAHSIPVPNFTPELIHQTQEELRTVLGTVWERIKAQDDSSRPDRDRHLLPVVYERAARFEADFAAGRYPGHLPDFMALYLIVSVLRRTSHEPAFRESLPGLADRGEFRHFMLTMGLADHLRLYTSHPVRLPARDPLGGRIVDVIIDGTPGLNVETKSSEQFDGPMRHVNGSNAYKGIRTAWRSAYGGENPQLPRNLPGAILVGGVTVELASMRAIYQRAEQWLRRRGRDQPLCWGILAMTYITLTRTPAGRHVGDGAPLPVRALASPFLQGIPNPHYTGGVRLVFQPPVW